MAMKDLVGKIVGLDTMLFIYHIEDNPKYAAITERLFDTIEHGSCKAVTSILTLIELLIKPKREGNLIAVGDYRDMILTFPNLMVMDVNLRVSDIASDMRAKYRIRVPDAIQIASAIVGGSQSFITNDEGLKKVKDVNIILLDEWL
ncbi:MAG: type II toxin-antitoxin system VapC family toxin [Nitrospinae bacterium]|nr:type II toxin-antitoxin system VapC family toxin [Nitrospinota bacterium]